MAMNVMELNAYQELRFLVGEEPINLELRRGLAEVYGTEMRVNQTYTFPKNSKAAIFTYQGATIEISGSPLKIHVGQKCDYMAFSLNVHSELELMRSEAQQLSENMNFKANTTPDGDKEVKAEDPTQDETNKPDLSKTPICLVCKPMRSRNFGKSTLCRILLNYATRRGRVPIFVDLDPDQNHIGLPGSIGALSIESPIDIETGLSLRSSMLMHYGHTNFSADESKSHLLYKVIIENLAKTVHLKLANDKKSYYSGVIINTASWSEVDEYELLVHACRAFKVNRVLIMDNEELENDLKKDLSDGQDVVKVLNMPKIQGLMTRVSETNVEQRYMRIKEYFYGTEREPYRPSTSEIKFQFLKRLIYKVEENLMLADSLLPLGAKARDKQLNISQYECHASDLLHRILAISYCRIDDVVEDPEVVLRTNIMGFICITSVKADGEIVSILTPQKLPNPMDYVLLYSDVQYVDSLI